MIMAELKIAAVRGVLPVLQYCVPGQLQVDESYQRGIEEGSSQSLIRRIAQEWDWSLCQPLLVARRADGGLWVIDGQHRLTAARLRGDIAQLPCVILDSACPAEEAAHFVRLNQNRKPLHALALFRAALASGDREAQNLVALLDEAGLQLSRHMNNVEMKPGHVCCIGGLRAVLREHGERVSLIAMRAIAQAWPGQVLRYSGSLYQGLGMAVAARPAIDAALLAAVLGGGEQRAWIEQVAALRLTAEGLSLNQHQAAAQVIGAAYDEAAGDE